MVIPTITKYLWEIQSPKNCPAASRIETTMFAVVSTGPQKDLFSQKFLQKRNVSRTVLPFVISFDQSQPFVFFKLDLCTYSMHSLKGLGYEIEFYKDELLSFPFPMG
jgi:hypothetical protein